MPVVKGESEVVDGVFPPWLSDRKDFQKFFPRFSLQDITEEERIRIAVTKPVSIRTVEDLQWIGRWIGKIPIMSTLSTGQALEIAKICHFVSYTSKEYIFQQDDVGDSCYITFAGQVDVLVNQVKVASIGKGACFGDLALEVLGGLRSASIQASCYTELLMIRAEDYHSTLHTINATRKKQITKWLRKEIPLLSEFSEHKLKYLESVSIDVTYNKGDTIYLEGSEVGPIYFLKSGQVQLSKKVSFRQNHRRPSSTEAWTTQVHKKSNNIDISIEKMGDYFGAELFLDLVSRNHTAVAIGAVHLIAINKADCSSSLFHFRDVEQMSLKYQLLNQKCREAGALQVSNLQADLDKKSRKSKITNTSQPIRLLSHFPNNKMTPDFQFPCLINGKAPSKNAVIRIAQTSALPATPSSSTSSFSVC